MQGGAPSFTRQIFYKACQEYGERVAKGLDLDVKDIKSLAETTQEERVKVTAQK